MIEAVIAMVPRQRGECERMVRHCRDLDGTVVRVVEIPNDDEFLNRYPNASFASRQSHSLRRCAEVMRGKSFFWLESDSPPLESGWLKKLTEEYESQDRPYMMSSDTHPPHDLVGGIGFYGPETHWMIPEFYPKDAWDLWMINHIPELIKKTPSIQHKYGMYDHTGHCRPLLFPGDKHVVRPDALVFHRDKHFSLVNHKATQSVFLHSGDLGDIVAALPVIRNLGGGKLVLTDTVPQIRPMSPRVHEIKPLLDAQPYIHGVEFQAKPTGITHDFTQFRKVLRFDQTLTETQADWLKVSHVGLDPWLAVTPSPRTAGRVLVSRTHRYHNPHFPWAQIVKAHGNRILFVGFDGEHADFCKEFGKVEKIYAGHVLQLAEFIAGSQLFIGNQSLPCWIALALGHPLIQETHEKYQDSIIRRPNAQFVVDGKLRPLIYESKGVLQKA